MAKNSIGDFDVLAANNADITSVDITGATGKVKDGDNALRAIMALLKSGVISGYTTTATAAGTTTLTANSNSYQYFTGTTTQTITMPVTSTLELGRTWVIVNNSTGALTVNSSGANLIVTVPAGATVQVQCILLTGTTAASWSVGSNFNPSAIVGADVATAATLVLTNAAPVFNLTGTTTVTAVTLGTGVVKEARATSAFAFTQGASLIVNGDSTATDFTVPAGALLMFVGYAAGVVRVFVSNAFGSGTAALPSMPFGTSGGRSGFYYTVALDTVGVSVNGVEVAHWNSTGMTNAGTATIGGLVDISGAAAGQIKFPATANPSANANTLDEYEEGVWTPADASGAGLSFATITADYTKIGRVVVANFRFVFPVTASGANVSFSGLPFTSQNNGNKISGTALGIIANGLYGLAVVANSTTIIPQGTASGAVPTNANLSGAIISGTVTYFAAN